MRSGFHRKRFVLNTRRAAYLGKLYHQLARETEVRVILFLCELKSRVEASGVEWNFSDAFIDLLIDEAFFLREEENFRQAWYNQEEEEEEEVEEEGEEED